MRYNSTMRVIIVSQKVGDHYGQERIVSASSELLQKEGHQVEWVAEACNGPVVARAFHQLPELFHLNSFTGEKKAQATLEKLWSLAGKHDVSTPTLIHFIDHLDPRVLLGAAKRFPTVFTAHTAAPTCPASGRVVQGLPVCPEKSGWSCLKHHYRYHCLGAQKSVAHRAHIVFEFQKKHEALKKVRRLFAVSHFLRHQLINDGYPEGQVAYVPNPLDLPPVKPVDVPQNLFVGAARLVSLKGFHHAIEAFKSIEDAPWHFWILGDGPERERLGQLVEKHELSSRIRFLGKRPLNETLSLLASATAVVQPNLGPEGFGMTVAEASALGKPVVAYDVPGLNEIIEHEKTGLLASFGDVASLALCLSRLIESAELRDRLGGAGQARMKERYSPEAHLTATLENYEFLLSPKVV